MHYYLLTPDMMTIFRSWTFSWKEVSLFKMSTTSFGIIVGIYFRDYLIGLMWLWWVLFIVGAAYFLTRWVKDK